MDLDKASIRYISLSKPSLKYESLEYMPSICLIGLDFYASLTGRLLASQEGLLHVVNYNSVLNSHVSFKCQC